MPFANLPKQFNQKYLMGFCANDRTTHVPPLLSTHFNFGQFALAKKSTWSKGGHELKGKFFYSYQTNLTYDILRRTAIYSFPTLLSNDFKNNAVNLHHVLKCIC